MLSRQLGRDGPTVSALGLACMGLTPNYAKPDPDEAVGAMNQLVNELK